MALRKKSAVRKGKGIMCNICGLNCGKGGALKKHIEGAHGIDYDDYKKSFYNNLKSVLVDSWDDSGKTSSGRVVVTHVLVRKFFRDPGERDVNRSATKPS